MTTTEFATEVERRRENMAALDARRANCAHEGSIPTRLGVYCTSCNRHLQHPVIEADEAIDVVVEDVAGNTFDVQAHTIVINEVEWLESNEVRIYGSIVAAPYVRPLVVTLDEFRAMKIREGV